MHLYDGISQGHIYTRRVFFLRMIVCASLGSELYGGWVGLRIPARKGTREWTKGRERGMWVVCLCLAGI